VAHGQWSEVEARGVLEAWRRSGLPLGRFARQRGLVPQRLHWRKRKLCFQQSATDGPELLPVRIAADAHRRGEPVTVLLRTGHLIVTVRPTPS
jgi:hypothetical protein